MYKIIILSISLFFMVHSVQSQTTYRTVQDGLWSSNATWTPAVPPTNLSGDIVIISHNVSHLASQNISWTNGSFVHIEPNASLDIVFVGTRKLQQLGGTQMLNEGQFSLDAGGDYLVEGASIHNTLTGSMDIRAKKVKFFDLTYNDTTVLAETQIQNEGRISIPLDELHNDGFIENSGYIEAMDIHNDGYICNSDSLVVFGEIDLHDNLLGYLACGGLTITCDLKMDGGNLWDQTLCCPTGPPSIDSTSASFQAGDIDYNSTTFNTCNLIILSSDLKTFEAKRLSNSVVRLDWEISEATLGISFALERSKDAIHFTTIGNKQLT